jgi:hypothetical protein
MAMLSVASTELAYTDSRTDTGLRTHTSMRIVVPMDATEITASTEARCLGCGRKISSKESLAVMRGSGCRAKLRKAARTADLSAWTPAQVEKARELIEDGGIVRAGERPDVFRAVSEDGEELHVTTPKGCNCDASRGLLAKRPCYHRCAAVIVLAADGPVRSSLGQAA